MQMPAKSMHLSLHLDANLHCVDPGLWHTELAQLNATVQGPGLTNVFWSYSCQHADNNDGASPCAYLTLTLTLT